MRSWTTYLCWLGVLCRNMCAWIRQVRNMQTYRALCAALGTKNAPRIFSRWWVVGVWVWVWIGGGGFQRSLAQQANPGTRGVLLKEKAKKGKPENTPRKEQPTTRPTKALEPPWADSVLPWHKRQRRRRPVMRRAKPPVLPAPQVLSIQALLEGLNTRDWWRQSLLIDELYRRGKPAQQAAYHAFQHHTQLRVRLLSAMVLSRFRDERPMPVLIRWSQEWFDHPNPTLTGIFLSYRDIAIRWIRQSFAQSPRPHHLLTTMSLMQQRWILPTVRTWFLRGDARKHQLARQALSQYDHDTVVQQVEMMLKTYPSATLRSALYRIVMFCEHSRALWLLIRGLQDRDDGIRFLVRLSLQDKAELVYRSRSQHITQPPQGEYRRDPGTWMLWWKRNEHALDVGYRERHNQSLQGISKEDGQKVLLLYRTLHPMFGYGRMPILIHDARWKNPPSPVPGKVWNIGLSPKAFAELLRQGQQLDFFRWPRQMGSLRDITVIAEGKSRRVSLGMIRHLGFERWEQEFIRLSRQAKVYLHFEDYFRRKDESDVVRENRVGQWAYRSADDMVLESWGDEKQWKPLADIEGLFGVLSDILQYLPGRTRLNALDIWGQQMRFFSLLFGSRSQSSFTRDQLSKSRRMRDFQLQGIGVIYLMEDKIEQMLFDFTRILLPQASRFAPPSGTKIPLLSALAQVFDDSDIRVTKLVVEQGKPHRLFVRYKARDFHTVLHVLARLALRSAGDRILRFRSNPSGEVDRDTFSLVVQMQWEMLEPLLAPRTIPNSLRVKARTNHNIFEPLYR